MQEVEIRQRAQLSQIGAKDVGEEVQDVVGDAMVEEEVGPGIEKGILVAVDATAVVGLIPWLATGVGCVAIWLVTVPPLVAR